MGVVMQIVITLGWIRCWRVGGRSSRYRVVCIVMGWVGGMEITRRQGWGMAIWPLLVWIISWVRTIIIITAQDLQLEIVITPLARTRTSPYTQQPTPKTSANSNINPKPLNKWTPHWITITPNCPFNNTKETLTNQLALPRGSTHMNTPRRIITRATLMSH
jgi:hypothetical protein